MWGVFFRPQLFLQPRRKYPKAGKSCAISLFPVCTDILLKEKDLPKSIKPYISGRLQHSDGLIAANSFLTLTQNDISFYKYRGAK